MSVPGKSKTDRPRDGRQQGKACFFPTAAWMRSFLLIAALLMNISAAGCGTQAMRFAEVEPVARLGDDRPIPVPQSTVYDANEYYVESILRQPVKKGLSFSAPRPSGDVNALDQAPASSWYTPRLGYREISPQALLRGPYEYGPPQAPVAVVKAKVGGGNPGFVIADARGVKYLIKFDPPDFPTIETTTALVVNRLFWGFGYNVPEDYLFFFRAEELHIPPQGELTRDQGEHLLSLVAPPVEGRYRSTASRFIEGRILGPVAERGVRQDDPNDTIPHEERRILRALRVFCAFTNQSGIRPDNSLDTYVGEAGQGHVKHFLLDFGEAFGGHGAGHGRLWDGYEHMFGFAAAARNLVTLGMDVEGWEGLEFTPWRSVGAFEGKVFRAEGWKETYAYLPIRSSRPADTYWAAKIVGALTREHLRTLVEAADYPEPGAADYMVETLMERRRKILACFLNQVAAVEYRGLAGGQLRLLDVGRVLLGDEARDAQYAIRYYDDRQREVADPVVIRTDGAEFGIAVDPTLVDRAAGYLRVDVAVRRGDWQPPPAQFHLRRRGDGTLRLVGVVH